MSVVFTYPFISGLIYLDPLCFFFFFKVLLIFRQKGEEGEREKNISVWLPLTYHQLGTWPATQAGAWTWSRTDDPLFPRPALNPLGHSSRGVDPFCFLISLVKGLSILFVFSKNQLLISLIFYIGVLDSLSFFSALIIICFLLLI